MLLMYFKKVIKLWRRYKGLEKWSGVSWMDRNRQIVYKYKIFKGYVKILL